jgi:hypothetical protein
LKQAQLYQAVQSKNRSLKHLIRLVVLQLPYGELLQSKTKWRRAKWFERLTCIFYNGSDEPNRICSLSDIQNHRATFEDCQIAYAFFLGGNPDGPTELLKPNSSFPITIVNPPADEDDVVYLNIKENMEDGKSQTWFCGFEQSKWVDPVLQSFSNFLEMIKKCEEPVWRPQGQRMEPKYYSLLNFVGHYETAEEDAR